jgi:tetratricopeptide (TPR) repeat protein
MVLATPLVLILFEIALRLADFGHSTSFFLPMQIQGRACLVENDQFGWRFFGPDMARAPYPVVLHKAKEAGTVRVFVFGESAAYGDPQPEYGLPRMLEAILSVRFPERRFEVVNASMTGINSHVVLPIARDCADAQGDYWVIYMGNNEVVGPFGSGTVFGPKAPPRALVRLSVAFKATRLGQLFEAIGRKFQKRTASQMAWGGMTMFVNNHVRQDDTHMARVYANFQKNLDDIIATGLHHGAQVVVSTMARNVRDCAPFASEHQSNLSAADSSRWNELYDRGLDAQQTGEASKAIEYFRQAAEIDGSYADLHFRWGQCCLVLTNLAEAQRQFNLACDLDTLRFRSDSRINEIIKQAPMAHYSEGVKLVDAQEVLAGESPDSLVGDEFLYEHVHLNFEGNYRLARALAQQIAPTNTVWPSAADCARRLAFTDFDRSEGERQILQRLNDPPYTGQLNHAEEYAKCKARYESLLPACKPEALEQDKLICRQAVASWPEDWILRANLAMFEQKTGDNAAAAASFKRITEMLPQSLWARKCLGIALGRSNRSVEAMAAFAQGLVLDPDDVQILEGMAELSLGQGKNDEARQYFERILRIQPFYGPAHIGLGKIFDSAGQHEQARAEFQKSMEVRANTPAAFSELGKFFYAKGDYTSAATNFMDSLQANPSDAETHVNLAISLAHLGRWDDAQTHCVEALRLDTNLAAAHFCLGMVKGHRGDDAGAMEQFAESARLNPDLLEARLNLGIYLYSQHHDEEARQQFGKVLQRAPENKMAKAYLDRLNRRAGETPRR